MRKGGKSDEKKSQGRAKNDERMSEAENNEVKAIHK